MFGDSDEDDMVSSTHSGDLDKLPREEPDGEYYSSLPCTV